MCNRHAFVSPIIKKLIEHKNENLEVIIVEGGGGGGRGRGSTKIERLLIDREIIGYNESLHGDEASFEAVLSTRLSVIN